MRLAVYETLVRPGARGTHVGVLAESWQTDDARTWSIKLRPDVRFHNGRHMRASDVIAALDRARAPGMAGELGTSGLYASYLADATIDERGPDRLDITLSRPMADVFDVMAEIPIVAQVSGADADGGLCGTGPYCIAERSEKFVVMDAFREHWLGEPPFQTLLWRAEADESTRVEQLQRGQADIATGLSGSARASVTDASAVRIIEVPTSACVILLCNAQSGACEDRRVRQALNHAVDVRAIVETIKEGAATPLNGPFTPLHLGYDPATPRYSHEPDTARALLREAGYPDGLDIVIDIPTTNPDEAPALAALVAEQYRTVGVTTTIRTFTDRPDYAQLVKQKQMDDLACFDSTPVSTYRVLREKLHAGVAGPWWQGYRNPQVDRAIDEGAASPELGRRQNLYQHASRLVRDDAPWVFLYSPTALTGVGPSVGGVEIRPQGLLNLAAR